MALKEKGTMSDKQRLKVGCWIAAAVREGSGDLAYVGRVEAIDKPDGRPAPEAVGPEGPYKVRCASLLPLDLEALADAIASTARSSPFLNDLALRAARVAVESDHLVRSLPVVARREVVALCVAA